jgi:uncharacterized iron-regulated protein
MLEKEITSVRGLAFKSPVQAKIIARPADAAKSVQGYYSVKDKTLFLYDDIADAYQQGVLIHEMVHALQDQHFDLAKLKSKLHLDKYDDDAELALAALIEGDATYTMIEVLKKDQPKVAAMLDVPLEKAKNLHNAFLYAQGARYVKALKERPGGWANVNFAYKFPPGNTASIFNLRSVSSIDLGPGATRGAYAVFKELVGHEPVRSLALESAKGWRGDRVIERKTGKAWVVACADRDSGIAMQTALRAIKNQQPGMKAQAQTADRATWIASDGAVHSVTLASGGRRVYVAEARDPKSLQDLLEEIEGPLQLSIIATKDNAKLSFGQLLDRLLDADIVCIGESHDSELQHRVQLQVIKGLHAFDDRLGVGLEMFQRPFQNALDRYVAGEIDGSEFLKASEYQNRWGYDWSLYQPIVEFSRKNKLPVAALNASKELTARISKGGFAGLNDDEKKQLGPIDFQLKEHRDYWYERLAKMHGNAVKRTPEEKERSYQVMTVWDDYMAASAAAFQQERGLRRMVILAGSGHIDRGFGIPMRTARRTGGKVLTVKIVVGDAAPTEPVTDFVVVVR